MRPLQVEQGLGLGSRAPIFNRHVASLTRFIKLRDPPPGSSSPPPVLVAHARCAHPHHACLALDASARCLLQWVAHAPQAVCCSSPLPEPCGVVTSLGVVRHRYGNTIGDMASYDAFTLGGPYSVRGFNVGELAACRRFLEGAAELRVSVLGRQIFAFIEHGTDLGKHIAILCTDCSRNSCGNAWCCQ